MDPGERGRQPAYRPNATGDGQRLQDYGAAITVAKLDVHVRRHMVARVHGDAAICEALENRHAPSMVY